MIAAIGAPFAEAVRATFQPCTFLLLVPILSAVVAARATWQALAAATASAIVGGWLLVDNRWILEGWSLRLSAVVVAGLLVMLAVPRAVASVPRIGDQLGSAVAGAAMVGAISLTATLWWRPCVGFELGAILNGAQDGLLGQLLPMAAYMIGALVPVALIVAIRYAVEPSADLMSTAAWVFAAIGCVVAASIIAGQHDEVVVTLTRWTLE